jgi:hypothetical protein
LDAGFPPNLSVERPNHVSPPRAQFCRFTIFIEIERHIGATVKYGQRSGQESFDLNTDLKMRSVYSLGKMGFPQTLRPPVKGQLAATADVFTRQGSPTLRFGAEAHKPLKDQLEPVFRNSVAQAGAGKSGTVNTVFPVQGDSGHLFRADTRMLDELRTAPFDVAGAVAPEYPQALDLVPNFGQPVNLLDVRIKNDGTQALVAEGDVAMVRKAPGKPVGGTFGEMKAAMDRELNLTDDLLDQLDPLARDVLEMQHIDPAVYTDLFKQLVVLSQYFSLDPYPNNTMRDGHVMTPIDIVQPTGSDLEATPRAYGRYEVPDKPVRTLAAAAQYLSDEIVPITMLQFKPRIIETLCRLKEFHAKHDKPGGEMTIPNASIACEKAKELFHKLKAAYEVVEAGYKQGFDNIGCIDPDPFRFIMTDGMDLPAWNDTPQA